MTATIRSDTETHRRATTASIQESASHLQATLGRQLAAFVVGVEDGKTIARWASGEVRVVRDFEIERRLRGAYEITALLAGVESAETVRAWFIGLNPELRDEAPAEAIRGGRLADALSAARAFVAYG